MLLIFLSQARALVCIKSLVNLELWMRTWVIKSQVFGPQFPLLIWSTIVYDRNDAGDSNVSKSKSISKLSSVPPHFHLESSKILPPDLSVYRVISADFFKYPQSSFCLFFLRIWYILYIKSHFTRTNTNASNYNIPSNLESCQFYATTSRTIDTTKHLLIPSWYDNKSTKIFHTIWFDY